MPAGWPAYYPPELKPATTVIILKALKRFPEQTQTPQLCKAVISDLTPLFCTAVRSKKLPAHSALARMDGLLHSLLVYNCDHDSERYRLHQEARKSDEWLRLAEEIVRVDSAAPQDSPNLAEPPGPASGGSAETLPSAAPAGESIAEPGEAELAEAPKLHGDKTGKSLPATDHPPLGSEGKLDLCKIEQIKKAVAGRIRKNAMLPVYRDMWIWLEEGNTPADFISEKGEFLRDFQITPKYAYRLFNRVKQWRKKGINPTT